MKVCYVIYHIINKENGKYYIGCSKDHNKRWSEHRTKLNEGRHENRYLQRSWDKYGDNSFDFVIHLECTSEEEMFSKETDFIANTQGIYNLAAGGRGGNTMKNFTEEDRLITSENMSRAQREAFAKGTRTKEMCNAFANLSEEDRLARCKVWSAAQTGEKNSNFKYPHAVEQYDKLGNLVKTWMNLVEITNDGTYNTRNVRDCCNNKPSCLSHKGFIWKFKYEQA